MSEAHDKAESALKQADRAAKRGDLAGAERWSKVAERLAAAAERLAQAPIEEDDWEADEARRAELRRRLGLFCQADADIAAWERERDLYEGALTSALANNTEPPAPLRAHPAGGEANTESYMADFLIGDR